MKLAALLTWKKYEDFCNTFIIILSLCCCYYNKNANEEQQLTSFDSQSALRMCLLLSTLRDKSRIPNLTDVTYIYTVKIRELSRSTQIF